MSKLSIKLAVISVAWFVGGAGILLLLPRLPQDIFNMAGVTVSMFVAYTMAVFVAIQCVLLGEQAERMKDSVAATKDSVEEQAKTRNAQMMLDLRQLLGEYVPENIAKLDAWRISHPKETIYDRERKGTGWQTNAWTLIDVWNTVGRFCQEGFLDTKLVVSANPERIYRLWKIVEKDSGFVTQYREDTGNPLMDEPFETLAKAAKDFLDKAGITLKD